MNSELQRFGNPDSIRKPHSLEPLVLTREQVERYGLPRIPIKDSDRRKAGFEERFGEGAVELDALEAVFPGELARIVSEAIARYRQRAEAVRADIAAAARRFRAHCARRWRDVLDAHQEPLARLRADFAAMQGQIAEHQETLREISGEIEEAYGERLEEAVEAIDELREQFAERAREVLDAVNDDLEAQAPDPSEVDWPTADDAEADEGDEALRAAISNRWISTKPTSASRPPGDLEPMEEDDERPAPQWASGDAATAAAAAAGCHPRLQGAALGRRSRDELQLALHSHSAR